LHHSLDVVAEVSEFSNHLARTGLLQRIVDRVAAFFVPNPLVQDLPDQTTKPMADRYVAEALPVPLNNTI
jgi:hypothetical protein